MHKLVTFRLKFESDCRSFASNLKQVASYSVFKSTQLSGMGNESSLKLQAIRWRPSLADWGSGKPAGCITAPTVCWHRQCLL